MPDIKDLKFSKRMYSFERIPKYLFEQVEGLDKATIDRIYQNGPLFATSPTTIIRVLLDELHVIKGVLWANFDIIENIFFIKLLTVDKEYQSPNGKLMNKAKDFLFGLGDDPDIRKEICFLTTHPKAYQRAGAKRSKRIRMEITNESNTDASKDNQNNKKRDTAPSTIEPTE